MADYHMQTIIVGSHSPLSTPDSTAANFTQRLTDGIVLDGKWEACIRSITYPDGPVGKTVLIYCNELSASSVSGDPKRLFARLPPTPPAPSALLYYAQTSTLLPWVAFPENVVLNQLSFQLADSDGVLLPVVGSDRTIIELAIRQVRK